MASPSDGEFQVRFSAPLAGARLGSFQPAPQRSAAGKGAGPQKPTLWVQGYEEGKAAAEKECREKAQRAEAALLAAAKEFRSAWERETKALEPQVVDLALAIARSILKKEIDKGNYDVPAIVSEVLGSLRGEELSLTVRLHPEDHAALAKLGTGASWPGVELVADPNVPRASCAVDTSYGRIVREVDSLLAEVHSALTENRKTEAAT